jgi:LysM repeat protein
MIKKDTGDATRMMLPFALLVFIFLILVFKLINRSDSPPPQVVDCGQGSHQVQIQKGDTCWSIAEKHSLGVDDLLEIGGNEGIDCDNLAIGEAICVPK